MTDNKHPITPPDELVRQWATTNGTAYEDLSALCQSVADQAAQWGFSQRAAINEAELQKARDEQLEACCEWVEAYAECGNVLRAACRPKPKSQAEKALASLDGLALPEEAWQAVSAALERLRELEKSND